MLLLNNYAKHTLALDKEYALLGIVSIPSEGMEMRNKAPQFGGTLRSLRDALGLSQSALADALQSTQRHVSFLETGRSKPTPQFLSRLCTDLQLSVGQRANLFAASGLANPYAARDLNSDEIINTLEIISEHLLKNWPFPALLLDKHCNILRQNVPAENMFAALLPKETPKNQAQNLLQILLSDTFMGLISNWIDVSPAIYFRLQAGATRDPYIAQVFEVACAKGHFDHVKDLIVNQPIAPVFVPIEIDLGMGTPIRFTSFLGGLAANQDALVEDFEIELMMPVDATSDTMMRMLATAHRH